LFNIIVQWPLVSGEFSKLESLLTKAHFNLYYKTQLAYYSHLARYLEFIGQTEHTFPRFPAFADEQGWCGKGNVIFATSSDSAF
jgi:hypothetical protein